MNLSDMQDRINSIESCVAIDKNVRAAAMRANELLRAFRAGMDLPWTTSALDLHRLAVQVGSDREASLGLRAELDAATVKTLALQGALGREEARLRGLASSIEELNSDTIAAAVKSHLMDQLIGFRASDLDRAGHEAICAAAAKALA